MKDLSYYLNLDYPFIVKPLPQEEGGGYVVEYPDLPNCIGTGDTIEEAISMAMDARKCWIEASLEEGLPVPEPSIQRDPLAEYSGRFPLRMPKSLHKMILENAKKEGVSANQYLIHLISLSIGKTAKG
ncbi:type II toxin-antitoxin system HicB family antitoxin [Neomoorella mulderi]|uniref:HicB family protein n=1 Tax=Moorella mulderi DSM 14980 TaxID=1122241 RepID=A0A151AT20_9FIRM|nr:type II toxin-antitoxin system HicB family antitoxin [Moorella mulderi]KYH30804.1 HicB family protein [Moorella mulderi DSM 14980]